MRSVRVSHDRGSMGESYGYLQHAPAYAVGASTSPCALRAAVSSAWGSCAAKTGRILLPAAK